MVCFCPFCGGNDVTDDGSLRLDGDIQYECGDCHKVFMMQIVSLGDEEEAAEDE